MKCIRCSKECTEERIRQLRDGSVLIKAAHVDGTKDHIFHEWNSVSSFMYRPFPGDAKRRMAK